MVTVKLQFFQKKGQLLLIFPVLQKLTHMGTWVVVVALLCCMIHIGSVGLRLIGSFAHHNISAPPWKGHKMTGSNLPGQSEHMYNYLHLFTLSPNCAHFCKIVHTFVQWLQFPVTRMLNVDHLHCHLEVDCLGFCDKHQSSHNICKMIGVVHCK